MNATEVDPVALLEEVCRLPPAERLPRLRAAGALEAVLIALGDEAERLAIVEVGRALEASDVVISLADEADLPRAMARARRAHAQALAPAGRYEEALSFCREARSLAERSGDSVEAARARLASLHALAHLGRYAEAIAEGEAARAAFVDAGAPQLAARADLNLGASYLLRDDPRAALRHYERARSGLAREPTLLAQLDSNRGHALLELDEFDAAVTAFRTAADAFAKTGLGMAAAIAEGNLADVALQQGRLGRALFHFERARRHLERDQTPGHLARLLAEQAEAFARLGRREDAQRAWESAIPELDRHGLAVEAARGRTAWASALLSLGSHEEAERLLDEAQDAFDRLGHGNARARVELVRSDLHSLHGEGEAARRHAESALSTLRSRPADAASARHRLARLALESGDLDRAEAELDEAFRTAGELGLAPLLADLHLVRGLLHRARGRRGEAVADLRAAVGHVERLRGSLPGERFRAAFLGDRTRLYEELVHELLERGEERSDREAFSVVERAKSRALLDLVSGEVDLAEAAERQEDPAERALLAELDKLRARLHATYSRLLAADEGRDPTTDEGRRRVARETEQELDDLEDRLAATGGLAGLWARPVPPDEIESMLEPGEALVEWFEARGELLAFVVCRGKLRAFRALAGPGVLADAARRVMLQIGRAVRAHAAGRMPPSAMTEDARRELRRLHDLVFAPLQEELHGAERLLLVPHGPLHGLPLHAAWDGSTHLLERTVVATAPSASVLARLRRDCAELPKRGGRTKFARGSPLVVGVADERAPAIEREVETVASALAPCRRLVGEEATVERVAAEAEDAPVLHLAVHGRFTPDAPLSSGLRLADRWMTLRDVLRLQLRADLAVLSGCETGRSVVGRGDEIMGLLRGFLAAGARTLVVSLWTVDDETAASLAGSFYNHRKKSGGNAAALRAAQLEVLAERPHPLYWAPFILGGTP